MEINKQRFARGFRKTGGDGGGSASGGSCRSRGLIDRVRPERTRPRQPPIKECGGGGSRRTFRRGSSILGMRWKCAGRSDGIPGGEISGIDGRIFLGFFEAQGGGVSVGGGGVKWARGGGIFLKIGVPYRLKVPALAPNFQFSILEFGQIPFRCWWPRSTPSSARERR